MRKFLEINKIYFETIMTSALTVMAIVVTLHTNEITKADKQPVLILTNLNNSYQIENIGGPARNVDMELISFLESSAELWRSDDTYLKSVSVSEAAGINDVIYKVTHKAKGIILELPGISKIIEPNETLIQSITNICNAVAPQLKDTEAQIENYLKISYINLYGESGIQYIHVNGVTGHPTLNISSGLEFESKWREQLALLDGEIVSIDDITNRDLESICIKLTKKI